MFNAFRSSRAVPATPEERVGASAEHLPDACCLRPLCRGSASSCTLEATSEFASRYGPRLRNRRIASRQHPGSASAGPLTASRREPGYPMAQRLIGVGSFHPTRNAPLSRRTQSRIRRLSGSLRFGASSWSVGSNGEIWATNFASLTCHGLQPSSLASVAGEPRKTKNLRDFQFPDDPLDPPQSRGKDTY